MVSNEELLTLNSQGFIPGPKEIEQSFLKRVELTKNLFVDPKRFFLKKEKTPPFELNDRLKKPDLEWVKSSLLNLFDITVDNFSAYFNNDKLRLFQGAATWILDFDGISLPLLQLKKKLKRGSFLWIYSLEDILAHELAHFARAGFEEPQFEEFFAYFTSSKALRKILGPIAVSSKEIIVFLSFLFLGIVMQYLVMIFSHKIFDVLFFLSGYFASKILFLGGLRLGYRRWIFNRCYKKLFSIFKEKRKTLAVMFRLTDKEIKTFAKKKKETILEYAKKNKEKSLRWKLINLAYFEKRS